MTYYLAYRNAEGRKRRYKIGSTSNVNPSRARFIAKDKAAEVTKGIDIAEERKLERVKHVNTLGEYIESEYREWLLAHRRSAKDTLRRLKGCFGHWYDEEMVEITPWIVEKWRVKEKKRGKSHRPLTGKLAPSNRYFEEHPGRQTNSF